MDEGVNLQEGSVKGGRGAEPKMDRPPAPQAQVPPNEVQVNFGNVELLQLRMLQEIRDSLLRLEKKLGE